MKSKEIIVVIGWGRMGITHAAILGGLYPERFEYQVVEPDKKVRKILTNSLGYDCFASIDEADVNGSHVLITTPPSVHERLVKKCIDSGAQSVFVEKPFGLFDNRVENDSRISVGYVLRFSEVTQTLKKIILEEGCREISLDYSSNTLVKKPKGWRNGQYGGVLNEMGSHLIDMILYLLDGENIQIDSKYTESVISDVDDIVSFEGKCGSSLVSLSLNWVNKDYRKPVWSGTLVTEKRVIKFDQQSLGIGFDPIEVDYYVRGRDFSLQMSHFIEGDTSIFCNSIQANHVHDVITCIKYN